MYYTSISTLNDDVLLGIFFYYRLHDQNSWEIQLGWLKLSHVYRRWRHLVHSSASLLGIHIQCTNGSPVVDTLNHIPPVPLSVDYRYEIATISEQDELGIYHALQLRDRVRRIVLHILPSTLQRSFMLMDESFLILEHLSLSLKVDEISGLVVPKTFLAPNLRHLTLNGVRLPKRLRLLTSTISLVTLVLTNIRASGYFRPRLLVARLQLLPQLEKLSIEFSIPLPRPSTEGELLGEQGAPVTLPNLKLLTFQGVSSYLERFIAQIRAPLLEHLDITLFGQIAFALSHLSHFIEGTEGLKLLNAEVLFWRDVICVALGRHKGEWYDRCFVLRVKCRQLDWQIDCAGQICRALMPVLSGIEMLTLDFHEDMMPTEWQGGEIDGTSWHELLTSFIEVKGLRICDSLSEELSRVLEIVLDPGLLPRLEKLISESGTVTSRANLFRSYIHARQVAGHPVDLSFSPLRPLLRLSPSSLPIHHQDHHPL